MIRKASAMWQGDLKTGKGTMTAPSGVMTNAAYSFATRFVIEGALGFRIDTPGVDLRFSHALQSSANSGCESSLCLRRA